MKTTTKTIAPRKVPPLVRAVARELARMTGDSFSSCVTVAQRLLTDALSEPMPSRLPLRSRQPAACRAS